MTRGKWAESGIIGDHQHGAIMLINALKDAGAK